MADENGDVKSTETTSADTGDGEATVITGEESDVEIRSITGTPINLDTYADDVPIPFRERGLKPSDQFTEGETITIKVIISPPINQTHPNLKGGVLLTFLNSNGKPVGNWKAVFISIPKPLESGSAEFTVPNVGKKNVIIVANTATQMIANPQTITVVDEETFLAKVIKIKKR